LKLLTALIQEPPDCVFTPHVTSIRSQFPGRCQWPFDRFRAARCFRFRSPLSGLFDMTDRRELKFVIADDDWTVLALVRSILNANGFRLVKEALDGNAAVRMCREVKPDIAVLDISMPLLNGIDAARCIIRSNSRTKIIVMTMHTESRYILESLRAGITGFVTKDKLASSLPEAIRAIGRGETYVSASGFHGY
jgi:CheY-like chemotaxis protein